MTSQTSRGLSGSNYDRWVESQHASSSTTLGKMQQGYWVAKQTVIQKLGKKEDESVIASDAELDSKLDLFKSIQLTSFDLQKIIGKYQSRLCNLSQEENCLGRLLKECGKQDKTRAGSMMTSVGKSMSYSAQQRLALRVPLLRLQQEVETFRKRAVLDTGDTVGIMEKSRTEYRGALLWMKNVSQELDPDTYKQLENFRKVQGMVRKNKLRFDRHKIDCMQKIDLLSASRCNMFSHALILYQNNLIHFWEKTANTLSLIAENFKGHQHYEFNIIKELVEPSRRLAEQTNPQLRLQDDPDRLLFFEEYHDEDDDSKQERLRNKRISEDKNDIEGKDTEDNDDILLDIGNAEVLEDTCLPDDLSILNDILSGATVSDTTWDPEWEAVFGKPAADKHSPTELGVFGGLQESSIKQENDAFLPSQLLEISRDADLNASASTQDNLSVSKSEKKPVKKSVDPKKEMAWFNLFAELDPLANPDSIGGRPEQLG